MVLEMTCDRCGKGISASAGEYVVYQDKMLFTCKDCAKELDDEIKRAQRICAAVDSKNELVKKSAVEKHPKIVTAEIPGAGGLCPATSSTTAATAPAAWSWQVVGKML